jgi:hypothetical protein
MLRYSIVFVIKLCSIAGGVFAIVFFLDFFSGIGLYRDDFANNHLCMVFKNTLYDRVTWVYPATL